MGCQQRGEMTMSIGIDSCVGGDILKVIRRDRIARTEATAGMVSQGILGIERCGFDMTLFL